ncbi:DUF2085 domain-containing protein [Clostridium tertium]|uniref:DUF2085 domain-containing protein n=1 Tax=Clostridium tertium TaxID=1559 RepID=UPI003561DF5D
MNKKDKIWLFFMKLFSKTCHQKSERSFFFYNYQFPICARCTGLLIGYLLGILALFFNLKISISLSLIFAAIMFIDWFIQHKKVYTSNNTRRVITGFLCGFGIISTLVNFYAILVN